MGQVIAAVLCMFVLCGCATKAPRTVYITAPVTPPPVIERPELEVSKLKDGDGPDVVIQAHRLSIKTLQAYAAKLVKLLDAYRQ